MRGPSELDCAKSFARTGVASAAMRAAALGGLPVQQAGVQFIPLEQVAPSRR